MTDEEKAAGLRGLRPAPCPTGDALCAAGDWCSIGGGVLAASMMGAIPSQREPLLGGHRFFLLFVFLLATLIFISVCGSEPLRFVRISHYRKRCDSRQRVCGQRSPGRAYLGD